MTPREYGAQVAASWPPPSPDVVEAAARILATVTPEPQLAMSG